MKEIENAKVSVNEIKETNSNSLNPTEKTIPKEVLVDIICQVNTIIDKNVQLHDWDVNRVAPFICWRHNGKYYIKDIKERRKFVQFLANELPSQTLYSVYHRFQTLYSKKKKTYAR